MIYFSERDLFSIDLFVADARTGEVIKKITNTATNSHYESLSFLTSAGAWDPAGKRFVFPGISKGEPVLTIVDVDRGNTEREIKLTDVHEVINPAWSPDGKQIVFSGLIGGFTDLFVYDLDKSKDDDGAAAADDRCSTPSWIRPGRPTARQIAFSTDRFTTNLETIKAGKLRLALMDVATGAVRELGGFADAKNISPQWAADGNSIYFLSDRQGITNIYRTDVDSGKTTQLTNMLTGASGITALSPAMSFAGGRLVFSAYENDGYNIYALDTAEQLAGEPVDRSAAQRRRAAAAARRRAASSSRRCRTRRGGCLARKSPAPASRTSRSGALISRAAVVRRRRRSVRDVCGRRRVVPLQRHARQPRDRHGGPGDEPLRRVRRARIFYLNRTHRWNWGASLDQTPYVSRGFQAGLPREHLRRAASIGTCSAISRHRLPQLSVQPIVARGVLRRLPPHRPELRPDGADLHALRQQLDRGRDPARDVSRRSTSARAARRSSTTRPSSARPARFAAAATGMEFSQSAGSLTYSGVLADLRTYLMPVKPYTIALRGMYYGRLRCRTPRMGSCRRSILGYPGLVRGYDQYSFESQRVRRRSRRIVPGVRSL